MAGKTTLSTLCIANVIHSTEFRLLFPARFSLIEFGGKAINRLTSGLRGGKSGEYLFLTTKSDYNGRMLE
jgi:hypothetical protein